MGHPSTRIESPPTNPILHNSRRNGRTRADILSGSVQPPRRGSCYVASIQVIFGSTNQIMLSGRSAARVGAFKHRLALGDASSRVDPCLGLASHAGPTFRQKIGAPLAAW